MCWLKKKILSCPLILTVYDINIRHFVQMVFNSEILATEISKFIN